MIGMAFAAIAYGMIAAPSRRLLARARRLPADVAAEVQCLAHLRHQLEETWLLARRRSPWLCQVDRDHLGDAAWAWRHDDHARREEHRFRDRVRDEDDRRA